MIIALVVIALVILAFLGYVSTKPDIARFERSTTINAPAEKIFPLIDNFHNWTQWSPFEDLDPEMKRTYKGPDAGVGATYGWEGKGRAGAGKMKILESNMPTAIKIDLTFIKPFAAKNIAEFTLTPDGSGTKVLWATYGPTPFLAKLFHTLLNMDKVIGKDFEKGLASMKAVAEG